MKQGIIMAVLTTAISTTAVANSNECPQKEYNMGLRYFQQSAEVVALQRQAYNIAKSKLDNFLLTHKGDLSRVAIISDVDETIIDNSELIARDANLCHDFSTWDTWKVWEREGSPKLIPGSKEFLDYAHSTGIKIFYVSNRYEENKKYTLKTLKKLGLPQVNNKQVLLYGPSKTVRRNKIKKNHHVIMQLGDTLHDFAGEFTKVKRDLPASRNLVNVNSERFGVEYIMFPNSSYGYWSKAKLNKWNAPLKVK